MPPTSPVCLSWKQHAKSLASNAWRLLQDEAMLDLELECQGRVFHLHKLVLAASCLYFRENLDMISSPGRVTLRLQDDMGIEANEEDVWAAINFMYVGELAVVQERLQGVMDIAQMLGIYGLPELILEQGGAQMADGMGRKAASDCQMESSQGEDDMADERVTTPDPYSAATKDEVPPKPVPHYSYMFGEDGTDQSGGDVRHGNADEHEEQPERTTISVQTDVDMWNIDAFQKHRRKSRGGQLEDEHDYFVSMLEENMDASADTQEEEVTSDPLLVEKPDPKKPVRRKRRQRKPTELEGLLSKPVESSEVGNNQIPANRPHLRSAANNQRKIKSQQQQPNLPRMIRHSKDRPFECDACEQQFSSREAFKLHVWKSHKLGSVYKCDLCPHMTPIKSSFMKHLLTHKDTKDFSCPLCGKAFKSRGGLNIHFRSHQGDDFMFKCSHCAFKTLQKFNLVKHLATRHGKDMQGNDLAPTCRCSECDFVCIAEHILKAHVLRKHTVDKPFKCEQCGYATVEKAALEKHVRIRHTNERPYMCEVCGFSSHTISGITRHRRSHTGVKPYKCDECGQQYADRKRLRDHLLKHANEKPFICEVCGCTFRRKDNLQAHLRKNHQAITGEDEEIPVATDDNPVAPVTEELQPQIQQAQIPVAYAQQYGDVQTYEDTAVATECGFSAAFAPQLIYVNNGAMHMGYYMTSGTVVPQAVTQVVTSAVVPPGAEGQQQQHHSELILVRTSPLVASAQPAPGAEAGI